MIERKKFKPINDELNRLRKEEEAVRKDVDRGLSGRDMRVLLDRIRDARKAPQKQFKEQRKYYDQTS
jgi:hypothetical protein